MNNIRWHVELYNILIEHFNIDELKELYFILGLEPELYDPKNRSTLASELIKVTIDKNLTTQLIKETQQLRPKLELNELIESAINDPNPFEMDPPEENRIFFPTSKAIGIPPSPPSNFIGHRDLIETVKKELIKESQYIVEISGMGGVGKTALAKQICHEIKDQFPGGVFWENFMYETSVKTILENFARLFGFNPVEIDSNALPSLIRGTLNRRSELLGRMILVLNNFEVVSNQYELNLILESLPENSRLFLTSRGRSYSGRTINYTIDSLNHEESRLLLGSIVGNEIDLIESQKIDELLGWLGGLPLFIEIMGGWISRYGFNHQILEQLKTQHFSGLDVGLEYAFHITFKYLTEDEQALFLLIGSLDVTEKITVSRLAPILKWNQIKTESTFHSLANSNLIHLGEEPQTYSIHPLVKSYARSLADDMWKFNQS